MAPEDEGNRDLDLLLGGVEEKLRLAKDKLEHRLEDGTAAPACTDFSCSCAPDRSSLPTVDRPVIATVLNKDACPKWVAYCRLRREIGELKCEQAALTEEKRGEKLLAEYYEQHPEAKKYLIECPLCMDVVPLVGSYAITPCCGIFLCGQCSTDLFSEKSKNSDCAFCRTSSEILCDDAKNEELLEERIAEGKGWAMWQKGNSIMIRGRAFYEDNERALKMYQRAYEAGFERAAAEVARCYYHLWEHDNDREDHRQNAIQWSKSAFKIGGIAFGGYHLAKLCKYESESEALRWLSISAACGLSVAQVELGMWYQDGLHGLDKSSERAKYWFEKAVDQKENGKSFFALSSVVMEHAFDWYHNQFGYIESDVSNEVVRILREGARSVSDGPMFCEGQLEILQKFKEAECSNCLCKKRKEDCDGGFLPIKCMRCHLNKYCSLQCLGADWKARHKNDCCPLE